MVRPEKERIVCFTQKVCIENFMLILYSMNYVLIADCLWYMGHVLTGIAIIANHYNYLIGIACVFVGQFATIISRPIGRIQCERNHIKAELGSISSH